MVTGNDNNIINSCDIRDGASTPKNCIYALGSITNAQIANSDITISNCNIYNFFRASSRATGINIAGGNSKWNITGNSLYQTTSPRNDGDFYGIYMSNLFGGEFNISANYIGGTSFSCGGGALTYTRTAYYPYFRGIYMTCSTTGISYIRNNVIKNINFTTMPSYSGEFLFFPIMAAAGRIDVISNTIGDATDATLTPSITLTINANATPTFEASNMGIYKEGDGSVLNNVMGSISLAGSIAAECRFYGIQILGTLISDALVSGNVIGNSSTSNSIISSAAATPAIAFIGILFGTDGNYRTTVANNTIANINLRGTNAVSWIQGMDNEATAGSQTILGNSIYNITTLCRTPPATSEALIGIRNLNTNTGGVNISKNTIHSLTASGAAVLRIDGIMHLGPTGASNIIEKNFIHSFSTSNAGAYQVGIYLAQGPTTVSNNMIRLGVNAAGASVSTSTRIYGILKNTASNTNFYFNSVYIGGNNTGAAVNTFCLNRMVTGVDICKNNIFWNARTAVGLDYNYALVINTNVAATFTSDYNDLFSSVAANLTSYSGGGTPRTIVAWRTGTGQDANSRTEDPLFIRPNGDATNSPTGLDLHLQAGSLEIGRGIAGSGVLVDYDNEQRSVGISPSGPCIGADEVVASAGKNAYGIWMSSVQATGNIADCEIYAAGGTPGGLGIQVANPNTANWANVNISGYQIITEQNIQCKNTNINFTTTDGTPEWLMGNGSNPASGNTNPITVQYTSTGRKDIIESVKVFKDFTNITMPVPSSGTILGAPAGAGCPTTYNYTSSVAGSAGFAYVWSAVAPGGCTATIATPNASSTDITFVNLTGYNQVFIVYLDITTECCGPLTRVTRYITIYPAPLAPVVPPVLPLCTGGTQPLTVNPIDLTYAYAWYDASTGGSLLGNGTTYTVNPVLSGTTNYYVQATNSFGCTSSRTLVAVTDIPTSAPAVTNGSTCGTGDVTLTVTPVAGYTYNWYSGSCGGALLQSSVGSSYTATYAVTTNIFVSAIPPGCGASACATAVVTVNGIPPTNIWLGGTGGLNNWFISSNWTSGCIPTCLGDVRIPSGTPNSPDIGYNALNNAECRSLDLQNGAILSFSDTKAELDICGDFTHAGTLTTIYLGNYVGKVAFVSSLTAQQYIKTTGTGNFNDVRIDNTSGTPTVTLNGGNMVLGPSPGTTGTLDLQTGKLVTGANNVILNNTSPTAVNAGSSISYIDGNLRRYMATNAGTYYFPVGVSNRYTLAELLNNNLTNVNYIDSRFMTPFTSSGALNPSTAVDAGTPYSTVSSEGVWVLNATLSGAIGGNYSIKLWFNDGGGANPFTGLTTNQFAPLKRPSGSTLASDWTAIGGAINGAGTPGRTVAGGYAQRTGWSAFSEYAIGLSLVPLPIELVSFEGYCRDTFIELKWSTSQEINNDYFTIERSYDGENWEFVTKVNGAGNSNELRNYSYSDKMVYGHIMYYRLSQTDKNGLSNTYKMISTYCSGKDKPVSIYIYPNPANDQLNVIIESAEFDSGNLLIVDDLGRSLLKSPVSLTGEKGKYIIDLTDLNSGSYYLKCVFNKTLLPVQKFIIQKK